MKTRNAPPVQALLDAGARFIGKVITDERAFSMTGRNVHFGAPINPVTPDRITGGSSSGSASAVGHGLCDWRSKAIPAARCAHRHTTARYGIRPTHGRISRAATAALSPSFDPCGWFTRDAALLARVEPTAASMHEPIARRVAESLAGGARSIEIVGGAAAVDALFHAYRHIQGHEAWMTNRAFIERYAPPLGSDGGARLAWSRDLTAEQISAGRTLREQSRQRMTRTLGGDAVLLIPTMPGPAPRIAASAEVHDDYRQRSLALLCTAGMAGLPQINLPVARLDGAALGLSLVGPAGSDRSLLALAVRAAQALAA